MSPRASPRGSAELSRVAAAWASCQTTKTSECGDGAALTGPRKGRVKRNPGFREAEEPGVKRQCPRGIRCPRRWRREGRGTKSTDRARGLTQEDQARESGEIQ